jgi:hypothetical protein
MRGNRSAEFERRSALYDRLDRQLCDRTRFFAAAALINAELARLFEVLPAISSRRSFDFLSEAGAALEIENVSFARGIGGKTLDVSLDHALVCAEQARLQRYVETHQVQYPRRWEFIRGELNALLNDWYASLISRWCNGGGILRALREVRGNLGMRLDFATESHRIRIGLKVIEHIRREHDRP